jgi:hypothetical protein
VADAPKSLGQINPSATTLTTIYTVPGSTSAVVSTISVCNRSSTATSFRLAHRPAGAAIDNVHYFAFDHPILGNETIWLTGGIAMATTDVLSGYATLATLSIQAWGVEIT